MALSDQLKALARLPRSPSPFLTVYLNTRWDSEKERERVRIFVKSRLRECLAGVSEAEEGAKAREDAEKIEHYVRGLVNREWDEAYNGVAVFACSGLGVYRVLRTYLPFEDEVRCADRPFLRQAVENAHAGERGILAIVGADFGSLTEFALGGVLREFSFTDEEFPGRHEQGGWSQARYRRHVEDHLQRNLRRLAEHLVSWVDERGRARVALAGPDEVVSALDRLLPHRVARRVCERMRMDPHAGAEEVRETALRAFRRAGLEDDRRRLKRVLERGAARSAAGVEAVAAAVRDGRVHELFVARGLQIPGWKCFACGDMGERVPLGCPRCGEPVEGVELGEELIRDTLAADGSVAVVDANPGLAEAGGVAAALRYGYSAAG